MKHEEAELLLLDAVEGTLDTDDRERLDRHVARCGECRAWLDTYELMSALSVEPGQSSVPGSGASDQSRHFSASELSRLALVGNYQSLGVDLDTDLHLERCEDCRREIELVREAVRTPPLSSVRRSVLSSAGFALAASLLAVVALSLLTNRDTVPDATHLTGSEIHGRQTIEAKESIVVETTAVLAGAKLILGSEVVTIGNGFSVVSGGILVAGETAKDL